MARSFLRSSTVNFFGNFIKPQKFNDTIKGVTIYSENKDDDGNLLNLYIKKEIKNNEFQITYAKKGKFIEISKSPILVLYEGATITSKNNEITNISFSKSDFSLANSKTNTTTYKKTQEITSVNLIACIKSFYTLNRNKFTLFSNSIQNCSIENFENILKEFYKRFIIPFYIPVLCLVPFLMVITSKENPNFHKIRLLVFLLGLTIIILSETTIRLITNITIQNFTLVTIPTILLFILYIFLFNKFKINYKSKF